jgi:hypothetical protein
VKEPFSNGEDDLNRDRLWTVVADSVQETISQSEQVPQTVA